MVGRGGQAPPHAVYVPPGHGGHGGPEEQPTETEKFHRGALSTHYGYRQVRYGLGAVSPGRMGPRERFSSQRRRPLRPLRHLRGDDEPEGRPHLQPPRPNDGQTPVWTGFQGAQRL